MSVKFVISTLVLLLTTITFFAFDAIADSESATGDYIQNLPLVTILGF